MKTPTLVLRNRFRNFSGHTWVRRYTWLIMGELDDETIHHALNTARAHGIGYLEVTIGASRFAAVLERDEDFEDGWEADADGMGLLDGLESAITSGLASEPESMIVMAPCVGYFRMGPGELQIGSQVAEGTIVGSVAALGIDHEIAARAGGIVEELYVQPQQAVEYGQPILKVQVKECDPTEASA